MDDKLAEVATELTEREPAVTQVSEDELGEYELMIGGGSGDPS